MGSLDLATLNEEQQDEQLAGASKSNKTTNKTSGKAKQVKQDALGC